MLRALLAQFKGIELFQLALSPISPPAALFCLGEHEYAGENEKWAWLYVRFRFLRPFEVSSRAGRFASMQRLVPHRSTSELTWDRGL